MKYITTLLILFLWMVWHVPIDSQTVMTREEAIKSGVFHIGSVKAQLLRYRNEVLAQKNFRLSYLPAVSLTLSPVNFNHSMRLLQNPFDGDYYNVNDYSNTTTGGVTVSQKIGLTGGTFVLSCSLSLLREFSHHTTGISSVPLYAGYQQPLWGGGRSYRFEKEIQDLKTSYALKQLCSTIAYADRLTIGELSTAYNNFVLAYRDYVQLCHTGQYAAMRQSLQSQIHSDSEVMEMLHRQQKIYSEITAYNQHVLENDSLLHAADALSGEQTEEQRQVLRQARMSQLELNNSQLQRASEIGKNRIELARVDMDEQEKRATSYHTLQQTFNELANAVRVWKERYS